jgi:cytochrome c-type biogenesis protein
MVLPTRSISNFGRRRITFFMNSTIFTVLAKSNSFEALGVLIFLLFLVAPSVARASSASSRACVFGFDDLSSRLALDFLRNQPSFEVVFSDVNAYDLKVTMVDLLQLLQISGVAIIPPDVCLTCAMHGRTLDEVLVEFSSPTVGFFHGGVLTAVSVGVADGKLLSEALSAALGSVQVFTYSGRYELKDTDLVEKLEKFLLGGSRVFGFGAEASGLILPITFLAVTDSVNPCTFMVFTALLLITLQSVGRAKTLAAGLCFIYAVFVGYYALEVGVILFFGIFQRTSEVLAIVGLTFRGFAILNGLTGRSPIPRRFRVFLDERVRRTHTSLVASFALGLFSAFTLLPCSSGPYVVGLGLLSVVKNVSQAYTLLAYYNVIFMLPLVLILVVVVFSSRMAREVKVFRSEVFKRKGVVDILGGAALIVICAYILLS